MKKPMINLSRMQQESEQWANAEMMQGALDYATSVGFAVQEADALKIDFLIFAELDMTYALVSLPYIEVDDPAQFMRELRNRMMDCALKSVEDDLGIFERAICDRLTTNLSVERQTQTWILLKELYDVKDEERTSVKMQVIAMLADALVPVSEYEEITAEDIACCAPLAPYTMLSSWRELNIIASAEVRAAAAMADAADNAEAQWRSGTKLHFDFCGTQMDGGYWSIWNAVSEKYSSEVDYTIQELIGQMLEA